MNEALLHALKFAGLWLPLAWATSLATAVLYPGFRRLLAGAAPEFRSIARLIYGALAPLAATLVVWLTAQPRWAAFLVPSHCHAGECGVHAPVAASEAPLVFLPAVVSGLLMLALGILLIWGLRCGRRRLVALRALSRTTAPEGFRLVESPAALAWCMGLWRPEILVTRGLVEQLSEAELRAVMAHERAHAERYDNLRAYLLYWVTLSWPRGQRGRIRADLSLDAEQSCDRQAVTAVGDPVLLIDAMRRLAHAAAGPAMPRGLAAFSQCDLAARIRQLDGPRSVLREPGSVAWRASVGLVVAWALLVGLSTGLAHVSLEWLASLGFPG
jgi:Zn-dependent protease with chaperone function